MKIETINEFDDTTQAVRITIGKTDDKYFKVERMKDHFRVYLRKVSEVGYSGIWIYLGDNDEDKSIMLKHVFAAIRRFSRGHNVVFKKDGLCWNVELYYKDGMFAGQKVS